MDASYALARNVVNVKYEDLPSQAVELSKRDILDTLGTAIAGSTAPGCKEVFALVKEWGGRKESTVMIYGGRVPSPNAALVNATMAHARDYDDTHDEAEVHAGVSTVPPAFAIAERRGKVNGREFITAVALGIDVVCRMGLANTVGLHNAKTEGWIRTSVYGFFGAAATAGKLLHLNEEEMVNAFGIAYSQASGNLAANANGALSKRIQVGFAAKGGVTAALMAEKGITGAKDSLEGKFGLYKVYHGGRYNPAGLTSELGKRFEVANLGFKPYGCGRPLNLFIEAALGIVQERDIRPEDVDKITAYVGRRPHIHCDPLEVKRKPRTIVDAQFSLPYVIAVAVVKRKVTLSDFSDEAIKDRVVLAMAHKVTPRVDSSLIRRGISPAIVEIRLRSGEVFSKRIDIGKGNRDNPMTMEELTDKFIDCVSFAAKPIPKSNVGKIIDLVGRLEEVEDVSQVIQLLG